MLYSEISDEYHFSKFKQGIKITKPVGNLDNPESTIKHLFSQNFNVFLVNMDYSLNKINEPCAEVCGFDTLGQAIGKTAYDFAEDKSASSAQKSDQYIFSSNQIQIYEQDLTLKNEHYNYQLLTIKQPCYDEDSQLIGLLGCSIAFGVHSLPTGLESMMQLGLLGQESPIISLLKQSTVSLSAQQKRCAQLMLAGSSMKNIAKQMDLSPRTIETHINTMKLKLACNNKTELLLKLYDLFSSNTCCHN